MRNAPTVNGERLRVDGDERPRSKHHTAVAGELLSSPKGLMISYFRNREAMAACSRGRKPTGTRQESDLSREAAAEISARPIAVAASRLAIIFVSLSAGLRPQLVRLQVCFVRKVKVLFR
jgi:hypothetical protein